MTAKQKKNLRKKLYRKRKKLEQSANNSKLDLTSNSIDENGDCKSGQGEDDEEPDLDINIDDVAIGGNTDRTADKQDDGAAKSKKKA